MQYTIMALCLATVVLSKMIYKKYYNPVTIFSAIWFLIVYLANERMYGLYEVSQKTYNIVFYGVLFFIVGAVFGMKKQKKPRPAKVQALQSLEVSYEINYNLAYVLTAITIFILAQDAMASMRLYARGYSMEAVRELYSMGMSGHSGGLLYSILDRFVATPFAVVVMPLSAVAAFGSSKKNYLFFGLGLLIIILQIIADAGRSGVAQWLICVAVVYIALKSGGRKNKLSFKSKVTIVIIAGVCLFALARLSFARGVSDTMSGYYTYICGCLPHFDQRIVYIEDSYLYTYGFASLYGIVEPLTWVLSVFGINVPFFNKVATAVNVQEYMYIGKDMMFNAFVSPFYYLYLDGRMTGVIIGMFIWGFFAARCYSSMMNNKNNKSIYVYALLVMGLVFSMIRIPFVKVNYLFALLLTPFLFKKQKNIGNQQRLESIVMPNI